jgi:hypothetical protein
MFPRTGWLIKSYELCMEVRSKNIIKNRVGIQSERQMEITLVFFLLFHLSF